MLSQFDKVFSKYIRKKKKTRYGKERNEKIISIFAECLGFGALGKAGFAECPDLTLGKAS